MVYCLFSRTRKLETPLETPISTAAGLNNAKGSQDRSEKGRENLSAKAEREKERGGQRFDGGAGALGHSHQPSYCVNTSIFPITIVRTRQNCQKYRNLQVPVLFSQGLCEHPKFYFILLIFCFASATDTIDPF